MTKFYCNARAVSDPSKLVRRVTMSKTTHAEANEPTEMTSRGNLTPTSRCMNEDPVTDDERIWLCYGTPAETWPADVLGVLARRGATGPVRRHHQGTGIADWGAVPGTCEGAHRYYFAATRGRECFRGTTVANSARAVERWLRDVERAEGHASRDPRHIAEPVT